MEKSLLSAVGPAPGRKLERAPRLLEQLRQKLRTRHYSHRTEQAYCQWVRRFVLYHERRHPSAMGEQEIAAFLTHLATEKRVVSALVAASKAIRQREKRSPAPEWTSDPTYLLPNETELLTRIGDIDARVQKLAAKRQLLESQLTEARELYGLLYKTGAALEHSIRLALNLLGFDAQQFRQGESEFDVVFTAREGRFLGEAEGKDNKAVNVDKMSQLERNLQEDFAREEVEEFAKGVLFANAFRFTRPDERASHFTDKCISAAKRLRVALIRAPDLFPVAKYLSATADAAFATACRKAIFEAEGEIVAFPPVPSTADGA